MPGAEVDGCLVALVEVTRATAFAEHVSQAYARLDRQPAQSSSSKSSRISTSMPIRITPVLEKTRQFAKRMKVETYALYLAYRDPRVPWYAKALAAFVVAHTFSPIDLIPDFIPR